MDWTGTANSSSGPDIGVPASKTYIYRTYSFFLAYKKLSVIVQQTVLNIFKENGGCVLFIRWCAISTISSYTLKKYISYFVSTMCAIGIWPFGQNR